MDLSDNALRLWAGYFLNPKSTLRFGGEGAEMEITPEARAALDELLAVGAVRPVEPDSVWPGREHYGSGEVLLHEELKARPRLHPFVDRTEFVSFRKKAEQRAHPAP